MKSKQELQELRERGVPALQGELKEARNRLFQDRVRFATRNLDNSNPLRVGRKRVARILTLLREAELKETPRGTAAAPVAVGAHKETGATTTHSARRKRR
jgi:large subunit ribosomal protein L29